MPASLYCPSNINEPNPFENLDPNSLSRYKLLIFIIEPKLF
jgi:hypothetical protein